MIRSAFNEPLDFKTQSDICYQGHAIESRICAEDPITMLPSAGTIVDLHYVLPQGGRFDHCAFSGYQIKSDFDPMFGKFVVRANNRDLAIKKMLFGLRNLDITGLNHNIPLLLEILQETNFQRGHYTTGHISEHQEQYKRNILESFSKEIDIKFVEHALAKINEKTNKLNSSHS